MPRDRSPRLGLGIHVGLGIQQCRQHRDVTVQCGGVERGAQEPSTEIQRKKSY